MSLRERRSKLAKEAWKRVAAAVIVENGKALIAQRSAQDRLALKWEFPGGKLEAGETPEGCLKREIAEELALDIAVTGHFMTSIFRYETGLVELIVFFATIRGGTMRLNVHADVRWVDLAALAAFDFAPADIPVVYKLMDVGGFDAETGE